MGGMQPGDKLTAANLNAAYMCATDDTSTSGSLKTEKFICQGKRDEPAGAAQALVADVGVILLDSAGVSTHGAASLSAGQNGQVITILNGSGAAYTLNFLANPLVVPDGQGAQLFYCASKAAWLPVSTGSGSTVIPPENCKLATYSTNSGQQFSSGVPPQNIIMDTTEQTDTHVELFPELFPGAGFSGDFRIIEPGKYLIIFDSRMDNLVNVGMNFQSDYSSILLNGNPRVAGGHYLDNDTPGTLVFEKSSSVNLSLVIDLALNDFITVRSSQTNSLGVARFLRADADQNRVQFIKIGL